MKKLLLIAGLALLAAPVFAINPPPADHNVGPQGGGSGTGGSGNTNICVKTMSDGSIAVAPC